MRAFVLDAPRSLLRGAHLPKPSPQKNQVLIKVQACGICRTDLHIVDGELPNPIIPLIPGHQIVGIIEECGSDVSALKPGMTVGVPWLGWTCGKCAFCVSGQENLCDNAKFTGYHINGGFAEYAAADERYCFPVPDGYPPLQAAPLLCAGLIGYRSYRMTDNAQRIGFYGFGSAAHIIMQVARYQKREVYAFTRKGDDSSQAFAKKLGAIWAGDSKSAPPQKLDAAIIFAPVGPLVVAALKAVKKGGTVVCAGIYMSDIPSFPYSLLWEERKIVSVANLTRQDGEEFMALAPKVPITTEVTTFKLEQANEALDALRNGKVDGSIVLSI